MVADQPGPNGQTPLYCAAYSGHAGIVQLLLERDDVDANHKTDVGTTPLAIAASKGKLKVMRLLLERKDVDVNSKAKNGRTVLELASGQAERYPSSPKIQTVLRLLRSAIQARSGNFEESLSHGK